MFCSNCGSAKPDGAKFCPACGQKTSDPPQFVPMVSRPIPVSSNEAAKPGLEMPGFLGALVVAFLLSVIAAELITGSSNTASNVGYAFGQLLLASVIAAIFGRKSRASFQRVLFISWPICMALAAYGSHGPGRLSQSAQLNTAIEHLNAAISNPEHAETAPAPAASQAPAVRPSSQSTTEAYASTLEGVASVISAADARSTRLRGELGALPLQTVLTPENLVAKDRIDASRETLAEAARLVDELEANGRGYLASAEVKLGDLPEPNRSIELASFQKSAAISLDFIERSSATERAGLKAMSDLLDLAERNLGLTQVFGEQILFSDSAALAEFQRLVALLNKTAAAETELEQEQVAMRAKAKAGIASLRGKLR